MAMKRVPAKLIAYVAVLVAATTIGACQQKPQETATASSGSSPASQASASSGSSTPSQAAASAAKAQGRDLCAMLTAKEVTEITGLAIERVEKKPDGCEWYASREAQQQHGIDTAKSALEKLNKEEPKSAEEGAHTMETLLKGVTGAIQSDKPFFAVSAQWENADQAEMTLKGTIGAIGGGLPGGKLEPIPGLGDRAYMGPAGSFYYVRKGPALLTFGLNGGTREQAVALAQRIVSKM